MGFSVHIGTWMEAISRYILYYFKKHTKESLPDPRGPLSSKIVPSTINCQWIEVIDVHELKSLQWRYLLYVVIVWCRPWKTKSSWNVDHVSSFGLWTSKSWKFLLRQPSSAYAPHEDNPLYMLVTKSSKFLSATTIFMTYSKLKWWKAKF